ncbi:MAG: RluA family pseudouridine synthase [Rhodothermales bacterium]
MEPEKLETIISLDVPAGYAEDERVDQYITRFLSNVTRSKVQKGMKEGRVKINDIVISRPSTRVQANDAIECRLNRPPPIEAAPEDIPIDIVYEDEYLLIVNKATGIVVHPAYGNRTGTMVNALLHHLGRPTYTFDPETITHPGEVGLSTINAKPQSEDKIDVRPGIVHRLDKDTSGLLVVAKDNETHALLSKQFANRTTRRKYVAFVWGVPPEEGRIEANIGRDTRDRKKMAVVADNKGKHAITNYETQATYGYVSKVHFRLETGRTHQIRVHAAHLGHPILGDETYGGKTVRYGPLIARRRAFFANTFKLMPRQALHALSLGFTHPHTREEVDFTSTLPPDMAAVEQRLIDVESLVV